MDHHSLLRPFPGSRWTPLPVAALLALLLTSGGFATVVTQVLMYDSSDTSGYYAVGGFELPQYGGISSMTFYRNSIQYGPGAPFSIDLSTPGTYDFTYTTTYNLGGGYADLELFFEGDTSIPGISICINRSDSNTPPLIGVPTSYYFTQGYVLHSGSGSASYNDGSNSVTVQKFTVDASSGVWAGDISISVQSIPEPSTLLLAGTALGMTLLRPSRARSR